MKVFIANFGRENYEWPVCRARGTIATMNAPSAQALWESGDRDGYIAERMSQEKTAAGLTPTQQVASRWFNLMTIVSESSGDLWIHRDGERLWWTVSRGDPPSFERKIEPIARKREVVVCHKPCEPWSDRTKGNVELMWRSLHPKARDFLSTEATLQQLSSDYAAYARALIEGEDLEPWHSQQLWKDKNQRASSKHGEVRLASVKQKAACREAYARFSEGAHPVGVSRMAKTTLKTAAQSNGQDVLRTMKNKEVRFRDAYTLEKHIIDLLDRQEGLCALTDLSLDYDEEFGDPAFFVSLDRIDSGGQYEAGNLQVVCRFANRWKGADDNAEFRRLVECLKDKS
ncbi:hypothetical protein [uncultured Jannaschia sp.]|uniref:hypothetical protein n=1 Tax=uncultured Jannaschia sp. TaxID=293347 RepID=UPI00260D895E|nr:hypothetical protein [uncultured Jannaschia sp.]